MKLRDAVATFRADSALQAVVSLEVLSAARKAGERIIVACHWPLLPKGSRFLLWDASELRQVLVEYADIVAAYLRGHHHEGGIVVEGAGRQGSFTY